MKLSGTVLATDLGFNPSSQAKVGQGDLLMEQEEKKVNKFESLCFQI